MDSVGVVRVVRTVWAGHYLGIVGGLMRVQIFGALLSGAKVGVLVLGPEGRAYGATVCGGADEEPECWGSDEEPECWGFDEEPECWGV